jgi:DNA-binding NarL/FixJ family response regulator
LAPLAVLLVDDNRSFLRILAEFLSKDGEGAVRVVGSVVGGRDAVAQAQRLAPDVILLDLAMPDVPGLALLPQLRRVLPDAIIIAVTLLDPSTSCEAALTAGADAFVSKMTIERELIPTIRRLASRGPRGGSPPPRAAG